MLKKMLTLLLLGGMGLIILVGCNQKSSRQFIEGKAAELSKVYPTEALQDLFERFPDGFSIHSVDLYDYKEGEGYLFQSIKLKTYQSCPLICIIIYIHVTAIPIWYKASEGAEFRQKNIAIRQIM